MKSENGFSISPKMKKCAERLISQEFDGNISKLCDELSIARSTFYRWYDKKEFKQYINFLIARYTETELFEIWKAIIETAKKGSPPPRRPLLPGSTTPSAASSRRRPLRTRPCPASPSVPTARAAPMIPTATTADISR